MTMNVAFVQKFLNTLVVFEPCIELQLSHDVQATMHSCYMSCNVTHPLVIDKSTS